MCQRPAPQLRPGSGADYEGAQQQQQRDGLVARCHPDVVGGQGRRHAPCPGFQQEAGEGADDRQQGKSPGSGNGAKDADAANQQDDAKPAAVARPGLWPTNQSVPLTPARRSRPTRVPMASASAPARGSAKATRAPGPLPLAKMARSWNPRPAAKPTGPANLPTCAQLRATRGSLPFGRLPAWDDEEPTRGAPAEKPLEGGRGPSEEAPVAPNATTLSPARGTKSTLRGSEAAASAQTRKAAAGPARQWGRHKSAQKQAKKSHHGTFTALSSSSPPATGSKTMEAASRPRSNREGTWPLAMWKTRQVRTPRLKAPASAMTQDASRGGSKVATPATRRGYSSI
jgi:hypothetical protein